MPGISSLLIDSFIKDALAEGVFATEALNVFRAAGGAIRTQTFLNRFRDIGGLAKGARALGALASTSPIPDQYISTGYDNQSKKYIYRVAVNVEGEGLRGSGPFGVTFGSNRKLSAAFVRQKAQEQIDKALKGYSANILSVSLVEVLQRQD